LGLQVHHAVFNTDYISRNNPEEVIGGADIQLLIDQVNKLAMLPGEEIMFTTRI
jgi:cell division protein FtsA